MKFLGIKSGFTLAEVLITLGIIGIVAAITIPTLIANINSHRYRSQFKKSISTLSQAGKMGIAQYGYDYSGIDADCGWPYTDEENPENKHSYCALLNGTLTGYTKINNIPAYYYDNIESVTDNPMGNRSGILYQLSDGSIVYSKLSDKASCSIDNGQTALADLPTNCYGFIDVNGKSLPNKEVSCTEESDTKLINDSTYLPCVVKNDSKHMTDIFPIVFHDDIVEPASNAAKYVLESSK